jgi:glycosyltransferase involved in cell wall biosynthesis
VFVQILFLTTSYPRHLKDEASIFVARLAESLLSSVKSITVIVPRDSSEPKIEFLRGISVRRFSYRFGQDPGLAFGAGLLPNLRNRPWQFWQLVTILGGLIFGTFASKGKDTRIVANWIIAGFAAAILKICSGIPFVYIVRGVETNFAQSFFGKAIFSFVIAQSGKTICVSQSLADQLKILFPKKASKITCISNGVTALDLSALESCPEIETLRPYLLSVGTVIPRKNLGSAIELLAGLEDRNLKLVVLGRLKDDNYFLELKGLVSRLGLENRVVFVGEIPPSEVPNYIAASEAFISTSQFEGMPNSLLEAMALKKPVLISDIPSHREVVIDGVNGILLDGLNMSLSTKRVSDLLSDSARMNNLGLAAYESVKNRTWLNCSNQYLEILTQL